MTLKVIMISAPPGAGKDTAAHTILRAYPGTVHEKFANPLRAAVRGLFNLSDEALESLKRSDYRIRELMILLSERGVKERYGKAWFGTNCADRIRLTQGLVAPLKVVISDAGFTYEVEAFCQKALVNHPDAQFELWNIVRPFCNYMNDSRDVTTLDPRYGESRLLRNLGTKQEFEERVENYAIDFFDAIDFFGG